MEQKWSRPVFFARERPLGDNSLPLEVAAANTRDGFSRVYGIFGLGFAILDLALSTFSRLCNKG